MATPSKITRAACGAACVNANFLQKAGRCYPLRAGRYPSGASLFEEANDEVFFFEKKKQKTFASLG